MILFVVVTDKIMEIVAQLNQLESVLLKLELVAKPTLNDRSVIFFYLDLSLEFCVHQILIVIPQAFVKNLLVNVMDKELALKLPYYVL